MIDNTEIKDIDLISLRNLMGIVTQESILFNDTIFNNIAFGLSNVSEDDVEQAAKVANAHEFIIQTKYGYHTNIGERGSKLSGGQRQRISIARAILNDPAILILDEATASIDPFTEWQIQQALDMILANTTSILIAIDAQNKIWINRRQVDVRAVRPNVERLHAENPKGTVVIQADRDSTNEVLVQVIKEGIGNKGPTLSTYISIPGRYLVLMPALGRVGVSRKIEDEDDRRRLRDILLDLNPPKGLGFIVRTAGQGRTRRDLSRDLSYLLRLWKVISRRIEKKPAPVDIYEESDMMIRTIRDILTTDVDSILIDDASAHERAKEFLELVMPLIQERIPIDAALRGRDPFVAGC